MYNGDMRTIQYTFPVDNKEIFNNNEKRNNIRSAFFLSFAQLLAREDKVKKYYKAAKRMEETVRDNDIFFTLALEESDQPDRESIQQFLDTAREYGLKPLLFEETVRSFDPKNSHYYK